MAEKSTFSVDEWKTLLESVMAPVNRPGFAGGYLV